MDKISLAIEKISSRRIRPSLEPIREALKEAGLLPQKFKKIIVAGTNGKGTTAFSLYSLLKGSGVNVGLLTSPHICNVKERIAINGQLNEADWLDALEYYKGLITRYELTFYEITVLLAYYFFTQLRVDVAIMEVGLGGRWDATNVGLNNFVIITGVGLDHQQYLGSTLESILEEKLQVIQPGSIIISGLSKRFHNQLKSKVNNSEVYVLNTDFFIKRGKNSFIYREDNRRIIFMSPIKPMIWGNNLALAIKAFSLFAELEGIKINDYEITNILSLLKFNGRWDIRSFKGKKILLDVAHNPQAWKTFFANVKKYWGIEDSIFLIGVLKDKNWKSLFKKLIPEKTYFFEVGPIERMLGYSEVQKNFSWVKKGSDPLAIIKNSQESKVVVTGSFYMISKVLCRIEKEWENPTP